MTPPGSLLELLECVKGVCHRKLNNGPDLVGIGLLLPAPCNLGFAGLLLPHLPHLDQEPLDAPPGGPHDPGCLRDRLSGG